jgi:hypothetical protein
MDKDENLLRAMTRACLECMRIVNAHLSVRGYAPLASAGDADEGAKAVDRAKHRELNHDEELTKLLNRVLSALN